MVGPHSLFDRARPPESTCRVLAACILLACASVASAVLLTAAPLAAGASNLGHTVEPGVGDGSTDGGNATARSLSAPGNRSLEALALPEDGTPASFVEHRDWIVLAFETPGLSANLSTASDLNASTSTDGVSVAIEETLASTGTGQRPDSVPVEAFTLVRDPATDRFFLVAKASELPNVRLGDEFRATLRVNASEHPDASSDATANTTVTVSEYLATVDGAAAGRVRAGQSMTAGLSGTTTAPEGTELVVRIRTGDGDDGFLRQKRVRVDEDGSWRVAFDVSDVAVGTEFEVSVLAGPDLIANEDAVVVSADAGDLEIVSFDAPSTVTTTDDYAVATRIANTGNASTSTFVAYVRDGRIVESRAVTVGANASTVVTFRTRAPSTADE